MKIKKQAPKKTKTVPKKKVVSKVRTVTLTKKVVKKTKTAPVAKAALKKHKTIAAIRIDSRKEVTSVFSTSEKRELRHSLKRWTYMVLALTVGILSAGFVTGILEKIYIENNLRMGHELLTHQFLGMSMFLLPVAYIVIFGIGICFGIWLGFWGWRVVYIEHNHRIFRKK
ncbi:MAG: hypothetical protein WCI36_03415 [bacterium]